MTAPSRTADEIIADWHAGRADHDPYDEIGGLRTENEQLRTDWQFQVDAGADLFAAKVRAEADAERWHDAWNQRGTVADMAVRHVRTELARTEGDLGVAIREAARQRENVERVRALHQPTTKQFLVDGDCGDGGVCDHDGMDCPVGAQTVCAHCFTLGDSQSEWETNIADAVLWPCPSAIAMDDLPLMDGAE